MSGVVVVGDGLVQPPFPIPMRGNEFSLIVRVPRMSCLFPIPMRGNETLDQAVDRGHLQIVPDPYEG